MLPLSQPIRGVDGSLLHQIAVPKGTTVVVDLQASNRNTALWGEDAYEWKPQRWLEPLPEALEKASIPGVYSHLCVSCFCVAFCFAESVMMLRLYQRT